MKKCLKLFLLTAIIVILCAGISIASSADDEEVLTYGNLKYVVIDEVIEIVGYTDSNIETVDIPDSIDGKIVRSIRSEAFRELQYLSSLKIGKNVKKIGSHAFLGCPYLVSVIIPDQVTEIGSYCFASCSRLKTVYIGKSTFCAA